MPQIKIETIFSSGILYYHHFSNRCIIETEMINSILILLGIVLMVISVIQCIKLIQINSVKHLQWAWLMVLVLIVFFLIGYIAYYFLSTNSPNLPVSSLLICLILF